MKYLFILLLLTGCNEIDIIEEGKSEPNVYIVTGQSNALGCDWSYFEELTDSRVINMAVSGISIKDLIEQTNYDLLEDAKAVLYVHGESDGIEKTEPYEYIRSVKEYQKLLGDLDFYISNVGYYVGKDDFYFDRIRNSVSAEAKINDSWFVSFDDAKYFRNWGMLLDGIHFNSDGCMMMMDAFAEQTYK